MPVSGIFPCASFSTVSFAGFDTETLGIKISQSHYMLTAFSGGGEVWVSGSRVFPTVSQAGWISLLVCSLCDTLAFREA